MNRFAWFISGFFLGCLVFLGIGIAIGMRDDRWGLLPKKEEETAP